MKLIELIKCSGLIHPENVIDLTVFNPNVKDDNIIDEFVDVELNVCNLAKYADYDIDNWCINSEKIEVMIVEPDIL